MSRTSRTPACFLAFALRLQCRLSCRSRSWGPRTGKQTSEAPWSARRAFQVEANPPVSVRRGPRSGARCCSGSGGAGNRDHRRRTNEGEQGLSAAQIGCLLLDLMTKGDDLISQSRSSYSCPPIATVSSPSQPTSSRNDGPSCCVVACAHRRPR